MSWEARLVLLGAPLLLFAAFAAVTAVLSIPLVWRFPALREARLHAAPAGFVLGFWFANAAGRSLEIGRPTRMAACAILGVLLGWTAYRIARSSLSRAVGRGLASLGLIGILGFAGGAASLRLGASEQGGRRDPRDDVPRFPPLPNPPERHPLSARVIVLGLDGATWDKIGPLVEAGRLPNFARLRREGACGRLKTIEPTHSALIWTTVVTGMTPDVHGIKSHYLQQLMGMRRPNLVTEPWMGPIEDLLVGSRLLRVLPVTSNFRLCKALWNIVGEAGLRVAALGWWASQPPEVVNGWIVSEFASTGQRKELADRGKARNYATEVTTYPAGLLDQLQDLERTPESVTREELAAFLPVDEEVWQEFLAHPTFRRANPLTTFRAPYLKDLFFAEAALKIEREHRPDLLLSYLRGIDVFGHIFWRFSEPEAVAMGEDPKLVARYRDCVDRAYEWTDRTLGRYLERLGRGDTLVVLSDHGWHRQGPGRYGHHHAPDGILAVYGAHARAGAWVEGAHVLEVAPTLLHLLGLPKGEDMPGRVRLDFLADVPEPRTIPTWETTRSGTLETIEGPWAEERERELRALGYVR